MGTFSHQSLATCSRAQMHTHILQIHTQVGAWASGSCQCVQHLLWSSVHVWTLLDNSGSMTSHLSGSVCSSCFSGHRCLNFLFTAVVNSSFLVFYFKPQLDY